MMKVMLVDDEDMELTGLSNMIGQLDLPLNIVAQAWNGKQAVELARKTRPDIIISDVRMPVMSGADFIREIRPELPDAMVVMISGYEDFSAVRDALNLKVDAWLVKPLNKGELTRLLSARASVARSTMSSLPAARVTESLEGGEALRALLTQEQPDDIDALLSAARLHPGFFIVMLAAPVNREALYRPVRLKELAADEYAAGPLQMSDGHIVTVLSYSLAMDEALLMNKVEQTAEEWKDALTAAYHSLFGVGVSLADTRPASLPTMYRQALNALDDQVIYGRGKVIFFAEPQEQETLPPCAPLSSVIAAGDFERFMSLLQNELEAIAGFRDIIMARSACIHLLHELAVAGKLNTKWRFFAESFSPENLGEILKIGTLPELLQHMKQCADIWKTSMEVEKVDRSRQIVDQITGIVLANLGGDLSSEAIADRVYLTPAHIRRVVKNVLGITLQDYVLKMRMQRACELLAEPALRVTDVAARVGYESVSYFGLVFRKFYGHTPGEHKSYMRT